MEMDRKFSQPPVVPNQTHFAAAPSAQVNRSTFDRSSALKTTFDSGVLVPIFLDEVLPGDTFDMSSTMFCRLATPLKPFMDNVYIDVHYWFVPNRLVWDNWQKFMGEQEDPNEDITTLTIPTTSIDNSAWLPNSIADYFGLPQTPQTAPYDVSALPFRAYVLIYNEWYRDENLINSVGNFKDDGPDVGWNTAQCLRRGKRKDYFTSALPFAQKGDPVTIPLGNQAPVHGLGSPQAANWLAGPITVNQGEGVQATYQSFTTSDIAPAPGGLYIEEDPANPGFPNLYADLSNATATTVNDLRTAFQIQKLLERDARGGTRYIELILSHFGVRSDDARLQRPEFLGGGTTRVNINPVASTFTNAEVPQGQLAGYGTSINKAGFSKSFTEHGQIIGLASVRADLTYQQGADRHWFRQTRYDYYWPSLAHLGEQAVLNREIYTTGGPEDTNVFGYQERNAEYRFKPSKITGKFSSENAASLDVWHLSQDFAALPVLDASFINESPPISRVVAVPDEPEFLCDAWFSLKTTRPMPTYAIPGFIDHF
ncbi:major capsid protein [Microviridae sp.]|nr:major capsid protein [Microviridae sp.]